MGKVTSQPKSLPDLLGEFARCLYDPQEELIAGRILDLLPLVMRSGHASHGARRVVLTLIRNVSSHLGPYDDDVLYAERGGVKNPTDPEAAVLALFGLGEGTTGKPWGERRRLAADRYHRSDSHFRQHIMKQLFRNLADLMQNVELEGTMTEARASIEQGQPVLPHLVINWESRLDAYFTVWSEVAGVQADTDIALRLRRDSQVPSERYTKRLVSSFWFYGSYLVRLNDFHRAYGGNWILADPGTSQLVANAAWTIMAYPPFDEEQVSAIRIAVRGCEDEIARLAQKLDRNESLQYLLKRWKTWLESCNCDLDHPSEDCGVHTFLGMCEVFIATISDDAERLTPWFQSPGRVSDLRPLDLHAHLGYWAGKWLTDTPNDPDQ